MGAWEIEDDGSQLLCVALISKNDQLQTAMQLRSHDDIDDCLFVNLLSQRIIVVDN